MPSPSLPPFPPLSTLIPFASHQTPYPDQPMDKHPPGADADDDVLSPRCGFLLHVQNATLLIGVLGSLVAAALFGSILRVGADSAQCGLAGSVLCSYALLVLGWTIRAPSLYWPFLLINPLCLCLCAVFCSWPSLLFLVSPLFLPDSSASSPALSSSSHHQLLLLQLTHHLHAMEFLCSILALLMLFYFQSIVFRAHNWLRKKNSMEEQLVIIGDPQTPV